MVVFSLVQGELGNVFPGSKASLELMCLMPGRPRRPEAWATGPGPLFPAYLRGRDGLREGILRGYFRARGASYNV